MDLGDRHYDVRDRAVVVGIVSLSESTSLGRALEAADRALGEGADALSLAAHDDVDELVASLRHRWDVPIGVATSRPERLRAALEAGAGFGIVTTEAPDLLDIVAGAVSSVVLVAPPAVPGPGGVLAAAARRARDAGLPTERIVLDVGLHGRMTIDWIRRRLDSVRAIRGLGHCVAVEVPTRDEATTAAVTAAALLRGCRLVAASDVRAARRVVDVVAAIEAARRGEVA